jgi:tetratricopeptide (TPR) repeat protein
MIALMVGAGLTVVSASMASDSPLSWTCAYVAERLPLTLLLLGDDTVSGEETRAARVRLSLSDTILTRASNLTLARSLGATRLVVVRCHDHGDATTIEAQAFDAERPGAGEAVLVSRPLLDLPAAIDEVAQRLTPGAAPFDGLAFRAPSVPSLQAAGRALNESAPSERSRGLVLALNQDPTSIGLRLTAIGALIAARDFEAALRLAQLPARPGTPPALVRALRFQAGAAQLEAGRFAEARDTFEALRRGRETAAVLNNLGVASFRLREGTASGFFERAASFLDHRQEDISFNLALTLLFEGKAAQALPLLDRALQATPTDIRTRLLRVWALSLLGLEPERAAEWERLVGLAPSFSPLGKPDLARRLERILFSERRPEA